MTNTLNLVRTSKHSKKSLKTKALKAVPVALKRVRRAPEEARVLILDAAERVFRTKLPDSVGLKEVAHEAGVSHALVSHYFGTYESLVEATLGRRVERLREELVGAAMRGFALSPEIGALLAEYRRALEAIMTDPVTVRLGVWSLLSGRVKTGDFFPGEGGGMRALTDALEARTRGHVARSKIEFALVTSFAMMAMWGIAKGPFVAALGRKHSRDDDAWFEAQMKEMIAAYLAK